MAATATAIRRKTIDDATQAARRQAIARREQQVEAVEAAYAAVADGISDWLQQHGDSQGRVPPEALGAFDAYADALLRRVQHELGQKLGEGMTEAAAVAAAVIGDGTAVDRIVQRTLQQLRDFIAADGLQLSDRVWRVGEATRRAVVDTVRNAILRGDSAREAANALIAQGQPVPQDLSLAARAANAGVLGNATLAALATASGSPLRNALRVTRTEINRAFTEAFVASTYEVHDIAAVKFNLSPLHPRVDICDFYATANLHGMGQGVYPRGAHPYPAHPETLSYLTVVFIDEITDADRDSQESAFDWLRRRSVAMQDAVLGKNKGAAFRAGRLNEDELLATWRQVRDRLGDDTP